MYNIYIGPQAIIILTLFHYLPFLTSFETDTLKSGGSPMESILRPLAHQSLDHPCQAMPVTLPSQEFCTFIVPVSMM